jgi:hypothetical protein
MKRFALFASALAWLAACDAPPVPTGPTTALQVHTRTSDAKISNESFRISGTILNPCPPAELVAFSGSAHVLVTGTETPGYIDANAHINTQGISGVGLVSGDRYSVLENVKEDLVVTGSSFDEQQDLRFRLVRQGSADNLWLRQTIRLTFPPFNLEIIRNQIECRG